MPIRVYSLEYGKNLWEQGCAKNCRYIFFGKRFFCQYGCVLSEYGH